MNLLSLNRSEILLSPIADRHSDFTIEDMVFPSQLDSTLDFINLNLPHVAQSIIKSKEENKEVICMIGGHVIKRGLSLILIELIKQGFISSLAMNGACLIHDFELAYIGKTSENVNRYIKDGKFGLWKETGLINDVVLGGSRTDRGIGECCGEYLSTLPYADYSVLAQAWLHGVPATVHIAVGLDINHMHPNYNGAAWGQASYRDFLIFAEKFYRLGVFLNYGSAVHGPELYLKALSMVRNILSQRGETIKDFTTVVFDLLDIDPDIDVTYDGSSTKCNASQYYCRPYKSILRRSIEEDSRSYYIKGDHRDTMTSLLRILLDKTKSKG